MEGNGMAGGMMPGMLGLDMPLHPSRHHHHRQTPPPSTLQHQQQQLLLFTSQPPQSQAHHGDADHNATMASNHAYPFGGGAKVKHLPNSEDEPSSAFVEECSGGMDLGMKQQQRGAMGSVSATPSPWQRMKWTDTMVKLLIMVVYCVGDDGGSEGGSSHHNNKAAKKGGSSAAGGAAPCAGLLQQQQQKKGKWKSVSRAMMEKGYYVSPQQCEDKFNDLNKRYKRVNDILGKGTACRVVENQALLDTMDNLSPKAKEEVRKLLNSKHLFFREMCAYHRSCAAAAAANAGGAGGGDPAALQVHHLQSCEALTTASDVPIQLQQQRCYHPSEVERAAFTATADEVGGAVKLTTSNDRLTVEVEAGDEDGVALDDEDEEEDEEEEEEEDDDYRDDDDDLNEDEERAGRASTGRGGCHHPHLRRHHEEDEDNKEFVQAGSLKRQRMSSSLSPLSPSISSLQQQQQQLRVELASLSGSSEQQRQWLKWRTVELEERRVSYGRRALELEKQRLKWLRFSGSKEREMERAKLENERLSLENDRMMLLLRQKEFDLVSIHGSSTSGGGGVVQDLLHHSTASPNGAPATSAA